MGIFSALLAAYIIGSVEQHKKEQAYKIAEQEYKKAELKYNRLVYNTYSNRTITDPVIKKNIKDLLCYTLGTISNHRKFANHIFEKDSENYLVPIYIYIVNNFNKLGKSTLAMIEFTKQLIRKSPFIYIDNNNIQHSVQKFSDISHDCGRDFFKLNEDFYFNCISFTSNMWQGFFKFCKAGENNKYKTFNNHINDFKKVTYYLYNLESELQFECSFESDILDEIRQQYKSFLISS